MLARLGEDSLNLRFLNTVICLVSFKKYCSGYFEFKLELYFF